MLRTGCASLHTVNTENLKVYVTYNYRFSVFAMINGIIDDFDTLEVCNYIIV